MLCIARSTEPRLSSCSTHAVHGATELHFSRWPETSWRVSPPQQELWLLSTGLTTFNDLIEAQEDQLFSTINYNPSIYFTTSYHHRQLLLKATTSGTCTELLTDHYPIALDISWTRTLFRKSYLKTCTERYAISVSLSGYLSLSPLYTTVILM